MPHKSKVNITFLERDDTIYGLVRMRGSDSNVDQTGLRSMANGKELVPHVGVILSSSNNHIGLLKHCSLLDLKYLLSHEHIPQSHCNMRLCVYL